MATEKDSSKGRRAGKVQLLLRGLKSDETPPVVGIKLLDRAANNIADIVVDDDGTFKIPPKVLEKAHRVLIGPDMDDTEAPNSAFLTYRAADFGSVLESGRLDIGRGVWQGWLYRYRCVSGTVSRCRRSAWWYAELARAARRPLLVQRDIVAASCAVSRVRDFRSDLNVPGQIDLDQLVRWPTRCSPICLGKVEVYRRVCCCEPWIVHDPRLEQLLEKLEHVVNGIPEIPDLPDPPGPGPDPAPYMASMFCDGALDETIVRAAQDLQAIRSLPEHGVAEYINARSYLYCRGYSCSEPVMVAEGIIGPDGRFNICWSEFPRAIISRCHEEYAYKVKQRFGPFTVTIYNGVAAGHWYHQDDEAALKSYHPWAVACRDNGGPGDAFVYLDEIGDTDSHLLATPNQTSATSVDTPVSNSGVAFPTGGPAGNGSHDRNWGGTLKLAMMFSESMRTVGAKYYRVSVTPADSNGDPVGGPKYVNTAPEWNKAVAVSGGVDIVPVSLGPNSTPLPNEQHGLFEIPYDGDLGTNADWESDQYHMYLNTNDSKWSDSGVVEGSPVTRHLVSIEVFNAAGERLRPNGTPPSGLPGAEVEAAFTFRRKYQDTGPTNMVPFGALTHMFWWDNREEKAKIEDLRMNGIESDEECQFLHGSDTSTFGIGYRAYHPWEMFQHYHAISWKRGLSGGSDTMLVSSSNVGVPPAAVGASPVHTFGHMLNHPPPPPEPARTKCAFTVRLTTYNKRTDGDNLTYSWDHDSAAFALEVAP